MLAATGCPPFGHDQLATILLYAYKSIKSTEFVNTYILTNDINNKNITKKTKEKTENMYLKNTTKIFCLKAFCEHFSYLLLF